MFKRFFYTIGKYWETPKLQDTLMDISTDSLMFHSVYKKTSRAVALNTSGIEHHPYKGGIQTHHCSTFAEETHFETLKILNSRNEFKLKADSVYRQFILLSFLNKSTLAILGTFTNARPGFFKS